MFTMIELAAAIILGMLIGLWESDIIFSNKKKNKKSKSES